MNWLDVVGKWHALAGQNVSECVETVRKDIVQACGSTDCDTYLRAVGMLQHEWPESLFAALEREVQRRLTQDGCAVETETIRHLRNEAADKKKKIREGFADQKLKAAAKNRQTLEEKRAKLAHEAKAFHEKTLQLERQAAELLTRIDPGEPPTGGMYPDVERLRQEASALGIAVRGAMEALGASSKGHDERNPEAMGGTAEGH